MIDVESAYSCMLGQSSVICWSGQVYGSREQFTSQISKKNKSENFQSFAGSLVLALVLLKLLASI